MAWPGWTANAGLRPRYAITFAWPDVEIVIGDSSRSSSESVGEVERGTFRIRKGREDVDASGLLTKSG